MIKTIKKQIYKIISKLLNSNKIKELVYQNYRELFSYSNCLGTFDIKDFSLPDQYSLKKNIKKSHFLPPVFITARFRSGSTFFWNLFKNLNGITSYYEPLHEKRFQMEGLQVDPSHLGVNSYNQEYQSLRYLDTVFNPKWACQNLYMDATHYNPKLKYYLDILIEKAEGRAVLQFNRVDFRLQWLKATYPEAKIVHLYRNPREQWMSILCKGGMIERDAVYKFGQLNVSNDFYTLEWARDLRYHFKFLEPYERHPYEVHYSLWRLSYLYGKSFSDISVSYEELVNDLNHVFERILNKLNIEKKIDRNKIENLNKGKIKERWRAYASSNWFRDIESRCDRDIEIFFRAIGHKKLFENEFSG